MSSGVEPYLKQELREIALVAMAKCRAPHAFPSDDASLKSLVNRLNEVRKEKDSSLVLEGAPTISPHSSDQLWVWFSLQEDRSIQLIAFQGIDQIRVTTRIDATGQMGQFVLDARRIGEDCRRDVGAGGQLGDDSGQGGRLTVDDEEAEAADRAEDAIFRAALVIAANREGDPGIGNHLDALAKAVHEKLGVLVFVARPSAVGPLSQPQSGDEMLEIGPVDGTRIQLRARVRNKQCSAWLTSAGRLMDLGSEIIAGPDPSLGAKK
jgi:hypothetical protein